MWSLVIFLLSTLPLYDTARTVYVAKDGTGQYTTVSSAVSSINPTDGATIIKIKNGIYYERVHITKDKNQVFFLGEDPFRTLIIHDTQGSQVGTFSSWTVLVESDGFIAHNIAFANNASNYDHSVAGQSVALDLRGDKASVRFSRILGAQDTLFTGSGRNYFYGTYINGSVDSIFGNGNSVFESCTIEITSYVTAHKGDPDTHTKYLIFNSTIQPPSNRPYTVQGTYLGRPWACFAWVIYKDCYLGDLISPLGWYDWSKNASCISTVNYDEYNNNGPGANPSHRVPWSHQLTPQQASQYTVSSVLGGWVPPLPLF